MYFDTRQLSCLGKIHRCLIYKTNISKNEQFWDVYLRYIGVTSCSIVVIVSVLGIWLVDSMHTLAKVRLTIAKRSSYRMQIWMKHFELPSVVMSNICISTVADIVVAGLEWHQRLCMRSSEITRLATKTLVVSSGADGLSASYIHCWFLNIFQSQNITEIIFCNKVNTNKINNL